MTVPAPLLAGIVNFSYLWAREAKQGLEEGRKDRPCVIIAIVHDADGAKRVALSPITHTRPDTTGNAIQIPAPIKLAIGLDDAPAWIIANEINISDWPGFDLRPLPGTPEEYFFGIIPPGLFADLLAVVKKCRETNALRTIRRLNE